MFIFLFLHGFFSNMFPNPLTPESIHSVYHLLHFFVSFFDFCINGYNSRGLLPIPKLLTRFLGAVSWKSWPRGTYQHMKLTDDFTFVLLSKDAIINFPMCLPVLPGCRSHCPIHFACLPIYSAKSWTMKVVQPFVLPAHEKVIILPLPNLFLIFVSYPR